ncbi:WD40/YVTN/BNR-like repeat-containing protein [Ramlibacter rhizophilus]|uniref:Exo-alpha-sialidase n=1 Tax=Ramlibacter rhizophilus TaxID=1781167 RepID=A0A4Z0BZC8_9BURK|nr:hypothetical protein [Ramlibacter rhizophilus]TFZ04331.1 hypothetical protein EZ242_00795 [Ramlibacter rhizophilus]
MSQGENKSRLHTVAALAALVLSACGGGGSGEDIAVGPPAPAPAPAPAPGPAPAPTPAPPPAPSVVAVTADTQAQPNQRYEVRAASSTTPIAITLPTQLTAGDTVAVTGVSDTPWELRLNPGQVVQTAGLPGNVAPGVTWSSHLGAQPWWWVRSSATGQVLTAGEIIGSLFVSTDGGATWNERLSDADRIWISADMTPDGRKIVAIAYDGGPFISNDSGQTWTAVSWPAFTPGIEWESVAISDDGNRILVSALGMPLQLSVDGGATWSPVAQAGSWRGVAMSGDGQRLVAVDQGGSIHTSTDGGLTWTSRTGTGDWYRVSSSDDGQLLAVAERCRGTLQVSRDAGLTWTTVNQNGSPLIANWTTTSVAGDGSSVAATATSIPCTGQPATSFDGVLLSRDGGIGFERLATTPGSDSNWRSISLSRDGNAMVAATGGTVGQRVEGQLYTSLGNRTSFGPLGAIAAGQNQSITLEYLGTGRFGVQSASGADFTTR